MKVENKSASIQRFACKEADLPCGTYQGQVRGFVDVVFQRTGEYFVLLETDIVVPIVNRNMPDRVDCRRVEVTLNVRSV